MTNVAWILNWVNGMHKWNIFYESLFVVLIQFLICTLYYKQKFFHEH